MTEALTGLFERLSPLWDMSLTAAWAAGAVVLLRLVLKKRAPRRVICLLWLVVFARLLVPVSLESPVSLVPPALSEQNRAEVSSPVVPQGGTVFQPASPAQPTATGTAGTVPVVTAPAPVENTPAPEVPETSSFPWKALLAGVWLAGAAGMLGCGLVTYVSLRRRVRFAVRVSGQVWEDENVTSPFILGLIRPRIYLPSGLEGQARRFILCHEFAHLRRFDHVVKPLCWLAMAVHWFNPAVWAAFLLLSRDMEGACDESVLRALGEGVKADYSYTLLALADRRRVPAPCPLAFDEGDAKGRIKNVLNYRRPALWIVVVSVLAVIVAAVCLLTNPVAEKPGDDGPDSSQSPTENGSGPTQAPEVSPSQAPDESPNSVLDPWMLEVLRGERTFSDYGTDRDIDHLAETFFGDEPPENLGLWFKLAFLDLDRDGAKELILLPMGQYDDTIVYQTGYLILRQEGDTVRGYHPGWRSCGNLNAYGTFRWSGSAFYNGIGRARFESGEFSVEQDSWVDNGSYFVEGQPVEEKSYAAHMEWYESLPEPFWYTFEDGKLCARVTIPVDDNVPVPDFLDADQQLLYRQATTLYTALFGPNTESIDTWPGPVELPRTDAVQVDGESYLPAIGLFANWDDLETAVLSVFTQEFWDSHNRLQHNDGSYYNIYTNVDGRTCYIPMARGNYGTNLNFPDTYHLPRMTDTEISFVLVGYYSKPWPLEGESYEERDARLADHWETYGGYPMKLVLTENGWRFDEFHNASTDEHTTYSAPNPALTDDPTPERGACVHGLDHVYVDHLIDGRLVYRCQEDFFPYYPPYPGAYSSESIAEGDYDGDGHIEEIVCNSAGTLMLCDVVPLDGQPVYGGKYGEMKICTFDPHTLTDSMPDADISTAWIEPGDELIYCVPLRDEPNGAPTGTAMWTLRCDGVSLTASGPSQVIRD